jgi:ABC-2 type transport system ATP-binding protein
VLPAASPADLRSAPAALPAVQVSGLEVRYGARQALRGVSLDVVEGELFGILGPNGSGKSTLFRVLSTLLPAPPGTLRLFGEEPGRDPRRLRRRLGVLFQSASLDPFLTVRENLLHHGHLYGLHGRDLARRIDEGLARVRLAERAGDRVASLSGGMKRRVEIAKALLPEPRLLLLDEPATGLDPGIRAEIRRLLEGLCRERGVTVVLTTHLMDDAAACDRLAILDQGTLVALDTPARLLARVGGDVLVIDTDRPETLAGEVTARFGIAAAVVGDLVRIEAEKGHELAARVAAAFPEAIRSVSVSRPTLEDVFLGLTGHSLSHPEEPPARGKHT